MLSLVLFIWELKQITKFLFPLSFVMKKLILSGMGASRKFSHDYRITFSFDWMMKNSAALFAFHSIEGFSLLEHANRIRTFGECGIQAGSYSRSCDQRNRNERKVKGPFPIVS